MYPPLRRFSLFVGLLILFCHPGFAAQEGGVRDAIDRGLAWVAAHPATSRDGGFPDLVDEALFYVTIKRLTADKDLDAHHQRAFEECISRLERSPGLERWSRKPHKTLIDHYHLLLATHLIGSVRERTADQARIIEEAQSSLANSRFDHPTFRLTIALLLRHLGATPRVSLDELLDAGMINRVMRPVVSASLVRPPGRPPLLHPLGYYALIHEVAALTDFGRLPLSPWLLERRARLDVVLREGARRAMMSGQVDLLAEILLCHHMLKLPVTGELLVGVDFLLATQRADGSWGEQATLRPNHVRHTVLTATAALLAYRVTAPCSPA